MPAPDRPARPKVVVTRRLPERTEARMAELFDVVTGPSDEPMQREALIGAIQDADVLVPTFAEQLDESLLAAAGSRLRLIANYGAGVDHIDLKAARARKIVVTNTPGVLTEDVADLVMALILSVPRRLAEGEKLVRSGQWRGWSPRGIVGHTVRGKKLGILGAGRIGRAVAKRAYACGMTIHYHNRERLPGNVEERFAATWWPHLDSMLRKVDVLTINTPHTPETHHLINAERLALLKPDAYLINAARGSIIDQDALIAALASGTISGAGLDVFPHEPEVDARLLDLDNVVLLPHMGSATFEAREAMGTKVIANIRAWSDGHSPPDKVLEGWA